MEWLKTILANVTVNDDGRVDVDSVLSSVKEELPKHFVAKTDYNNKVEELKTANGTIETLRKDNKDNDELQSTVTEYGNTIKELQKKNEDMAKTYSLKAALSEAGCSDPDYLIYKHGGLEKFTFDKEGKPVDAENVAKSYRESMPHVFPTGRKEQLYNPAGGGTGGGVSNPFAKETWNMTEQGKLYKENPAQAKELASAAGVEL